MSNPNPDGLNHQVIEITSRPSTPERSQRDVRRNPQKVGILSLLEQSPSLLETSDTRASPALEDPPISQASAGKQDTSQGARHALSTMEQLRQFQSTFRLSSQDIEQELSKKWSQGEQASPASFSKTSISSIINLEENNPSDSPTPEVSTITEKKKRAAPKTENAAKRAKAEPKSKAAKEPKTDTKKAKAESKTVKAEPKAAQTKKAAASKSKKKTPEVAAAAPVEKPPIHSTMTTDRVKTPLSTQTLPDPSFLESDNSRLDALGNPVEDPPKMPAIVLNIPLLDPKNPRPGQSEVIVNVMKMAEEKYGWLVVHPDARSAIDLMEDMLDDDDDGDDDEDEDLQVVDEKGNPLKKKDEPNAEAKKKKVQTKVNRKVGKYDYEDPFIDDEELQWEEEITTTKEGFFVYWGPLVDDRTATAKKSTGKTKK